MGLCKNERKTKNKNKNRKTGEVGESASQLALLQLAHASSLDILCQFPDVAYTVAVLVF